MNIIEYNSPQKILTEQEHRPNPLPDLPWVSTQRWEDVLFLHWPVSPEVLMSHIPQHLHLDLYDGAAWVGIAFFQVKGMRPRSMPALPWISSYLQLNVRTYVTYKGLPGVYFFSLDVDSRLACLLARAVYSLPFRKAQMEMDRRGNTINIMSMRRHGDQYEERMTCSYTPVSPIFQAQIGTLDHWLMERYCLWTLKHGQLLRTDIHHTKWNLQKAEVKIQSNTMDRFLPLNLFQYNPIVHYSDSKQALFWLPVKEEDE